MNASSMLVEARSRSGLTLRQLAKMAGTSHSTLSAYESGTKIPSVATLDRVLRSAGFETDVRMRRRYHELDGLGRGEELAAVLELAAAFPARHAPFLEAPVFPGLPTL